MGPKDLIDRLLHGYQLSPSLPALQHLPYFLSGGKPAKPWVGHSLLNTGINREKEYFVSHFPY
jgi:hypothetical protein